MRADADRTALPPPHVPVDRIVDFDLYDPPGLEHGIHAAWLGFRNRQPHKVMWTPRHGGHWIMLDGALVYKLYGDHDHCSNAVSVVPRPARFTPLGALNYDPPQHHDFRILLNTGLGMKTIRDREPMIRQLTIELIERFRSRGTCEFVGEFASILPLSIFLTLVDIPCPTARCWPGGCRRSRTPAASWTMTARSRASGRICCRSCRRGVRTPVAT